MYLFNSTWPFWLQALIWIRQNPMTFVTGVMALVTALYAKATTKYVEIAADQLAAQIAPDIAISMEDCTWQADEFCGTVVIKASKNTLALNGGDILLRCEHGSIRVGVKLDKWIGHSLTDGQTLPIPVECPFNTLSCFPTQMRQ